MGGLLSSFLGAGPAYAGDEGSSDTSHVQAFHSSARWQLHLNSLKETPKLVRTGKSPHYIRTSETVIGFACFC
ncbi:hypothetical protein SAY86_005433 [Trapa natans]|uniref:Uncharacterized protein n=1 Tax=Trapa natans TaxID=22666 RepID=A0AAN7L105_TRANT|nr:hypothetical protein SAY86_005433 [Trapa natans]